MNRHKKEIHIPGHSRCFVDIIDQFGHSFIRKTTNDVHYIPRLKRQINKQITHHNHNKIPYITIPKIYGECEYDTFYYCLMEYVDGQDFITFSHTATHTQIDTICHIIFDFIAHNIDNSRWDFLPKDALIAKLNEIQGKITAQKLVVLIDDLKKYITEHEFSKIPLGQCHGDLTFSNILISRDKSQLYFIDFLDSYIESPLQDIVKIQQDSLYFWTIELCNIEKNRMRSEIVLSHINAYLLQFIEKMQLSPKIICLLQIINLLRIVPYTQSSDMLAYLHRHIFQTFHQLQEYSL